MNGDWWRAALNGGSPVSVKILRGVTGELGESLGVDEVHEVSPAFGLWLVQRGKAEVSVVVPPAEVPSQPKASRRGAK